MLRLEGKTAIITGASGGIGRAISLLFASEGAKVVCTDLVLGENKALKEGTLIPSLSDSAKAAAFGRGVAETVAEIQASGNTAIGIQADISDEDSCNQLFWNTRRIFGNVDILINDAALTYFIPTAEIPVSWWAKSFAVNVQGPFMLCQKVLPGMMEKRSGAIVNITSGAAVGPGRGPYSTLGPFVAGSTLYGTTKAAIERFTQGIAEEVYRYGISVSCVGPSNKVATPGTFFHKMVTDENDPTCEPPEMMAKAVLLLASEPCDKVTGRVTYSQQILTEFGWIKEGKGWGFERGGSGFSKS